MREGRREDEGGEVREGRKKHKEVSIEKQKQEYINMLTCNHCINKGNKLQKNNEPINACNTGMLLWMDVGYTYFKLQDDCQ